jgi:hypothetical protein
VDPLPWFTPFTFEGLPSDVPRGRCQREEVVTRGPSCLGRLIGICVRVGQGRQGSSIMKDEVLRLLISHKPREICVGVMPV